MKRRVAGQRFHFSGSADRSASPAVLQYAHHLIAKLTSSVVTKGGGIVIQLGEEPIAQGREHSTIFDWTMLKETVKIASDKNLPKSIQGNPCIGIGFSDWKTRIPRARSRLVRDAVDKDVLEIGQLPGPLHIGGVLRERQAFYGDILVTIGGGPGVEHLAEIYRQRHQPVIPLDLPLKPGKLSAGERLNMEAMERPHDFFEYEPAARAAAALSNLSLKGLPEVTEFVPRFLDFVSNLTAPRVFCAHLLDRKVASHGKITGFFAEVVSKVMADSGFSRFDPGWDASDESFLNVEVFKMIQKSAIVVVDLTKLRPNCLLELGFALGQGKKTIITALRGTKLPFDTQALPCHFWQSGIRKEIHRKAFKKFVTRNINRRAIVSV